MASSRIEILPSLEAIRRRPEQYLGRLDHPDVPNMLLREALCCARDYALQGTCQRVHLHLDHDGRARVRDDGPGLPLDVSPDGRRMAEIYLSELFACANAKPSRKIADSTCTFGLAALNALSSDIRLRIFADGCEWEQNYSGGKVQSELQVVGPTSERGTELTFQLDRTLLPICEYRLQEFAEWVRENVTRLVTSIEDARTNTCITIGA